MTSRPNIMRLTTLGHFALWRLTLPGSATLLREWGLRRDLPAFKRVLNAFWRGVLTPVFPWRPAVP